MNNENEDLDNVKIVMGVQNIMKDNQYLGGNDSNKTTVIRIEELFEEFNIYLSQSVHKTSQGGKRGN